MWFQRIQRDAYIKNCVAFFVLIVIVAVIAAVAAALPASFAFYGGSQTQQDLSTP